MCLYNDIPSLQNSKRLSLPKAMAETCFLLAAKIWKILKPNFKIKFFAIQKKHFCDPSIFSGTDLELKKNLTQLDVSLHFLPVPESAGKT